MPGIILPKTYVKDLDSPLIFLAGPIRSAPDWQNKAIGIILSNDPDVVIASPRRELKDEFLDQQLKGDDSYFHRQRAWERHYLDIASKTGAILFWLPGEEEHNCRKVYGAMTRFESGLVLGWYKYDKSISFCVGTDGEFSEFDTMLYDFSSDAPNVEIKRTLEETCLEAIRLANKL